MTSFLPFSYRVFIEYCVFSEDFKLFRTLAFLCFPSVSVCVHTPAGRTPVLQQNLQSTEKSQNFLEKNTIIKEHPVCRRKKLYIFFLLKPIQAWLFCMVDAVNAAENIGILER